MRRQLHLCLLATAMAVGPLVSGASPSVSSSEVNIEEAELLVFKLIANGQYADAARLARTLLKAGPDDHAALLALAQAEAGLGRTTQALKAAKASFRAADKREAKYASATVTAQILAYNGQKLRSQIWLRRAAQLAPDAKLKQRAVRDFRTVRAATPLKVQLQFAVAPSSNVNNGSSQRSINFGGLPFLLTGDQRALSGLEYRIGADVSYTWRVSEVQTVTVGVNVDTRSYSLSSASKAQAPNVSASDLAFQQLSISVGTKRNSADGRAQNSASLSFGQNFYGGTTLTRFVRGEVGRRYAVSQTMRVGVGIAGERQWRADNDTRSATIWSVSGQLQKAFEAGSYLSVGATLSDNNSASAAIAHQSARLNMAYSPAKPLISGTQLHLSLGLEARDYDKPIFGIMREDTKVTAAATLVMKDLDYLGFSPTATLSASRNSSNIALYETQDLGVSFGLQSSF